MRQTVIGPGEYQRDEYPAGATDVEPGHLVERTANGVVPHSNADGPAAPTFAIEDRDVGKTPGDTYVAADNENVHVAYPTPGTKVNLAWLAAGESVTPGDLLVSAGDGTLQVFTPQADLAAGEQVNIESIVAVAEETLDNSGGASAVRLEVKSA